MNILILLARRHPRATVFIIAILTACISGAMSTTGYGLQAVEAMLAISVFFALRKGISSWFFSLPFMIISFLPYDYTTTVGVPVLSFGKLDPSMVAVIIVFVVFLVFGGRYIDLAFFTRNKMIFISLLLFFIWYAISWFINEEGITQMKYVVTDFVLSFGMALLPMRMTSRNRSAVVPQITVFISVIVASIGILEFFIGFQPYEKAYVAQAAQGGAVYWYVNNVHGILSHGSLKRIVSTIGDPLVLGYYLLMCLPFVVMLRDKSKFKHLWTLALFIDGVAIICTQDRTALLSLILILGFYAFKRGGPRQLLTVIAIFVAVCVIMWTALDLFGVWNIFAQRLTFQTGQSSLSIRSAAFGWTYNVLSNHMWFGIGPENSGPVLASMGVFRTFDNVFLTVVSESGFMGLLMFLLIYITVFRSLRNVANMAYRDCGYIVLLISFVFGFSYNTMFYSVGWGTFWFVIVVILKLGNAPLSEKTPTSQEPAMPSVTHKEQWAFPSRVNI